MSNYRYDGRTCAPDNQDVTETKEEVHYDIDGVKEGVASARSNLYNFPCICGATGTCKCHLENAGLRTEKIPSSETNPSTPLKKEDRNIGIQLHSSNLEQGSKPLASEEHPKGNGQMQATVYPTEFNNHVVGTNDKSASTQKNTSPHNFIFIKILPDANISKEENQKPNPGFKLMCRFCQKGFNSKTTMNTHQIKFHSDQRQSVCKICKRNFANDQSLRFHIKKGHTACEVCLESFPNVDDLESHKVKTRHKYLQRTQDNSPTRHKINKDMQTIWKQSITKLQYQCTHCKSYFISKETRQEHQRQAHPELRRFKCSICNGRYATNGSLRHHMNRTHKACHVCYTRFNDTNELERHKTKTGHKNDVQSCTDTPDEAKASTSQPQQIDPLIMPDEENFPLTDLGHFSRSVHEVSRILNTANYTTGMRNETNCIDAAIKDHDSSNFSEKQEHDNAHHPEFMSGTFTIKCNLCNDTFPSQTNLKSHLSAVHYSCAVCKTTFKDNTDFRIHRAETGHMSGIVIIFSEEEVKKPKSKTELKFKCRWCRKAFNSISVRIKHQKRFHSQSRQPPLIIYRDKNKIKPESYLCTACKMSFPTRKLRYTHVIQDHPELRVHRCHLCTESFIIKGYLINHLNEVHHACENCKTSYVTAKDLVRHQKETCLGDSANTSQVKCRSRKCRNFFRNLHERQEHIDAEHPELMTRIKCDFCDDTFSYRTNLRNHIDVEHQGLTTNERDLKTAASTLECSLCNEGFSSQTSLTNHLSAIHYFCAVCKVTFNDMIGLQKHKAETGHIPGCNLCKVCAQSFPTTKELKKHRREAGHGEVCPTCGCMIYSCLSSHMKSHTIEYKCHLCATGKISCPSCLVLRRTALSARTSDDGSPNFPLLHAGFQLGSLQDSVLCQYGDIG